MLLTLASTQGKQELSLILSSYALPDVLRFDGSIKSYSLHCASKLKSIESVKVSFIPFNTPKGTVKQATKNVQLVLQHCCKTS